MKHAKCRMNPVAGVLLAVLLLWQAGLSGCDFSAPALYTATYMDVFDSASPQHPARRQTTRRQRYTHVCWSCTASSTFTMTGRG